MTATPKNFDTVGITWNKVPYAYRYRIYMRTGSRTATAKLMAEVGNVTSYNCNELVTGTTYYFEVRALRGSVLGLASTAVEVNVTLPAPTSFRATAVGGLKVKLAWKNVVGADGYYVYRSTAPDGTYSLVRTVTTNASTITLSNQNAGQQYYYYLVAYRNVPGKQVVSEKSANTSCISEP